MCFKTGVVVVMTTTPVYWDTMKSKKNKKFIILGICIFCFLIFAFVGSVAWEYHEQPRFCASCHIMEPYLASWSGEEKEANKEILLAASHSSEGVNCLDCHPADIKQQIQELSTYMKGDYSNPLKQRKFSDDFCKKCYNDDAVRIATTEKYMVRWELATEYKTLLLLRGNEGLVDVTSISINPHTIGVDISNSSDPHHEGAQLPECRNCHTSHKQSKMINYCYTCHHSETLLTCTVCHGE